MSLTIDDPAMTAEPDYPGNLSNPIPDTRLIRAGNLIDFTDPDCLDMGTGFFARLTDGTVKRGRFIGFS